MNTTHSTSSVNDRAYTCTMAHKQYGMVRGVLCDWLRRATCAVLCRYLNGFEEYCTSTAITFRMDLPLKQPKAEGKTEAEVGPAAPPASSPTEEPTPDQESRGPQPAPCKVQLNVTQPR